MPALRVYRAPPVPAVPTSGQPTVLRQTSLLRHTHVKSPRPPTAPCARVFDRLHVRIQNPRPKNRLLCVSSVFLLRRQ